MHFYPHMRKRSFFIRLYADYIRIVFALRPFFERLDANLNIKYNAYYKAPCSALEPVQSRR